MNRTLVQQYLTQYKTQFAYISRQELYKWQAVQQFQQTWNPDAEDFSTMLSDTLSKTKNLMASGSYFPRRMINIAANRNPEKTRQAFKDLYL